MLRQSPDAVVRFKREFRALQDLHHTNLVRLGELVSEGEHLFFTMELVHGEDFLEHVRPSVIVRGPEAREGAPAHASLVNEPTVPFRRAGESAPEPCLRRAGRGPRASCGSAALQPLDVEQRGAAPRSVGRVACYSSLHERRPRSQVRLSHIETRLRASRKGPRCVVLTGGGEEAFDLEEAQLTELEQDRRG